MSPPKTMRDGKLTLTCEALRSCDENRCTNPAKYLAPYDASAVCGVHARAFLRCIPLSEFSADDSTPNARSPE